MASTGLIGQSEEVLGAALETELEKLEEARLWTLTGLEF